MAGVHIDMCIKSHLLPVSVPRLLVTFSMGYKKSTELLWNTVAKHYRLQGSITKYPSNGKKKLIFPTTLGCDMLVSGRVFVPKKKWLWLTYLYVPQVLEITSSSRLALRLFAHLHFHLKKKNESTNQHPITPWKINILNPTIGNLEDDFPFQLDAFRFQPFSGEPFFSRKASQFCLHRVSTKRRRWRYKPLGTGSIETTSLQTFGVSAA